MPDSDCTGDISIEKLQASAKAINPDTEGLFEQVRKHIANGLTLAQSIVTIANEQGPLRKPVSKADGPTSGGGTEQKKMG